MTASGSLPRLDPNTPTPARIYDYMLGGSHNFAADRDAAQDMIAAFPALPRVLGAARAFVRRATRFLAAEQGISQFLDLGSGIPTVRNVHEIAETANPAARVAYVDIDPVAVAHSRTILRGARNATCIQGDLRDPAAVCATPAIRAIIDFARPVAVILNAVLHFIPGDDVAAGIVASYLNTVAPGSYLVILHHTSESDRADEARAREIYSSAVQPLIPRSRAQITALFDGTSIVEPGIVLSPQWRPDSAEEAGSAGHVPLYFGYAGVGRKG
ncbi:MAG TPA: SAM-dependent methyltransferase [Streptosporangiaceae bacterium]|nr:SAM-dependent methyltransferase [Streptosporangiaceae bacterium]